jgi:hypothetical protein
VPTTIVLALVVVGFAIATFENPDTQNGYFLDL